MGVSNPPSIVTLQLAATAATDAELAALGLTKQDVLTAATDLELLAASAGIASGMRDTGRRLSGFVSPIPASGDVGKAVVWNGTGWELAPGTTLDQKESVTDISTSSLYSTFVDLSNFTVDVPPTSRPVWLEFHAPICFHTVALKYAVAKIVETTNANAIVQWSYKTSDTANSIGHWTIRKRVPASAVARSYKVQWCHGPSSGGGAQLGLNVVLSLSVVTAYFRAVID